MTPGARLQATIELLDALVGSTAPADTVIAGFLRQRRYVGSGDRRAILESLARTRNPLYEALADLAFDADGGSSDALAKRASRLLARRWQRGEAA